MKKTYKLIISLLIPQLAGGVGSIFTASSVDNWYVTLNKGPLNPPSWVFGPVWTAIFLLMGYALFLVWNSKKNKEKRMALVIFGLQLFLNILWSVLFFGLQSPELAFIEIIILWGFILLNLLFFYRVDKRSGWLLLPYLLWVTFATYLNFSLWILN